MMARYDERNRELERLTNILMEHRDMIDALRERAERAEELLRAHGITPPVPRRDREIARTAAKLKDHFPTPTP